MKFSNWKIAKLKEYNLKQEELRRDRLNQLDKFINEQQQFYRTSINKEINFNATDFETQAPLLHIKIKNIILDKAKQRNLTNFLGHIVNSIDKTYSDWVIPEIKVYKYAQNLHKKVIESYFDKLINAFKQEYKENMTLLNVPYEENNFETTFKKNHNLIKQSIMEKFEASVEEKFKSNIQDYLSKLDTEIEVLYPSLNKSAFLENQVRIKINQNQILNEKANGVIDEFRNSLVKNIDEDDDDTKMKSICEVEQSKLIKSFENSLKQLNFSVDFKNQTENLKSRIESVFKTWVTLNRSRLKLGRKFFRQALEELNTTIYEEYKRTIEEKKTKEDFFYYLKKEKENFRNTRIERFKKTAVSNNHSKEEDDKLIGDFTSDFEKQFEIIRDQMEAKFNG